MILKILKSISPEKVIEKYLHNIHFLYYKNYLNLLEENNMIPYYFIDNNFNGYKKNTI